MGDDANVGSIDAVREFRAVMATFMHESRDALTTFDMEARRALEWLTEVAPKYWEHEERKCEDRITEANIAFQACRAQKLPGGGQPACLEEKKALTRSKAHLVYIHEKQEKTKKWGAAANRQAIEYKGRSNQLQSVLDAELPNALALLDRVLNSLEAYIGLRHTDMAGRYADMLPAATDPAAADAAPVEAKESEAAAQSGEATGAEATAAEAASGEEANGAAQAEFSAQNAAENTTPVEESAVASAASAHTDK